MKVLSPLQKQLLEGITASKVKSEVSVPLVKDMSTESNSDTLRDESTLTYDELLVDFVKFNKSGVMKAETFDKLWNL